MTEGGDDMTREAQFLLQWMPRTLAQQIAELSSRDAYADIVIKVHRGKAEYFEVTRKFRREDDA